jgi:hypothetical protein
MDIAQYTVNHVYWAAVQVRCCCLYNLQSNVCNLLMQHCARRHARRPCRTAREVIVPDHARKALIAHTDTFTLYATHCTLLILLSTSISHHLCCCAMMHGAAASTCLSGSMQMAGSLSMAYRRVTMILYTNDISILPDGTNIQFDSTTFRLLSTGVQ